MRGVHPWEMGVAAVVFGLTLAGRAAEEKAGAEAPAPDAAAAQPAPDAAVQPASAPAEKPADMTSAEDELAKLAREDSLRRQQERYLAQKHFELGQKYYKEFRYEKAEKDLAESMKYFETLKYDPKLAPQAEEVRKLLQETRWLLGQFDEKEASVTEKMRTERQVKIEQAKVEVEHAIQEAQRFRADKKFDEAKDRFDKALEIIRWMPYRVDLSAEKKQAEQLKGDTLNEEQVHRTLLRKDQEKVSLEAARSEEVRQRENLRKRVVLLLKMARTEYEARRFRKSEAIAEEVLDLDPNNKEATALILACRRARYSRDMSSNRTGMAEELRRQMALIEETQIPYADILRYDQEHWEDVVVHRQAPGYGAGGEQEIPQWEQEIRNKLKESVSFNFDNQTFEAVVDFFRDTKKLNIVVDPEAAAKVNQTIKLSAANISVEQAFKWLMKFTDLDYRLKDGVVYIADKSKTLDAPNQRFYDIRDLTVKLSDYAGPDINLSAGGGGGAAGGNLFGNEPAAETAAPTGDEIKDMVKNLVARESWEQNPNFSIEYRNGQLVVNQTPEVQRQIQDFLSAMRSQGSLQVSIQARFITIEDNFLQDIGVDWRGLSTDPVDNAEGEFLDSDFDRRSGGTNPRGRLHDIRARTDAYLDVNPGGVNLSKKGGLDMQWAFLDELQVSAIVHMVEKTQRGNTLAAPKLTVFNTQRAHMVMTRDIAYISDYTVQIAAGAVGYDPDISIVQDGVVFDVRPIVSHDRRYITLDLKPTVATLRRPMQQISISSGAAAGGTAGTTGGGTAVATGNLPIQVPELEIKRVRTTVTVPDGGTLLIAGMIDAVESDNYSGLPWISRVPVIRYLFGERGRSSERKNLIILVKANVILIEEHEPTRLRMGDAGL
ncbi:MAG: hypothetical protein V1809_04130 [Planctomycetota bacterium]